MSFRSKKSPDVKPELIFLLFSFSEGAEASFLAQTLFTGGIEALTACPFGNSGVAVAIIHDEIRIRHEIGVFDKF